MGNRSKPSFYGVLFLSLLFLIIAGMQSCGGTSFLGKSAANNPSSASDSGTTVGNQTGANGGDTSVTNQTGAAGGTKVTPGGDIPDVPIPTDLKNKIGSLGSDTFNQTTLQKDFSSQKVDNFWVVTRLGNIYNFSLEGTKITATKQWKVAHWGTGIRTYVTEGGLVFLHNNGHVWFVDPLATPQGPLDTTPGGANFYQIANGADNIGDANGPRGCPVSFKDKNGKRFVAIGYHAGKLAIIPQADTPPYAPIWAQANTSTQITVPSAAGWGYSCFIDQTKLVYYGQWAQGATQAVDLTTLTQVNPTTTAPNGSQVVITEGQGSYAMTGDKAGNVFNKTGYYTFAKDTSADIVWSTAGTTGATSATISLWPSSCLQNGTGCTAVTYQNAEAIGPMSALPSGGGIIGLVRGNPGDTCGVYLLQLKDPTNINAGVNSTKLTTVAGDPYMYNDFTGDTLYTQNGNLSYDLAANPAFKAGTALAVVVVTWQAATGAPTKWEGMELDARCYKKGDFPPNFAPVSGVQDAGFRTFVQVGSCRNSAADTVELKVNELTAGGTAESRIKTFTVNFYQ